MNKLYFIFACFFLLAFSSFSQPTSGTTGLLNIPDATMQKDGTCMAGANFLPVALTPAAWDYNTGNYYLNITFLPFMELSYRMTLLKTEGSDHLNNQDRSFMLRLQLLKEGKTAPSIVFGFNDVLSSKVKISGNRKFSSLYIVATKKFHPAKHIISPTLGYAHNFTDDKLFSGVFGGVSFSPSFLPQIKLMAEYDTKAVNAGAGVLFFKHIYLYGMAHELKRFAGGFTFLIYLGSAEKLRKGKNDLREVIYL